MPADRIGADDTYCPKIAVAALDVLGVKGLVSTSDDEMAVTNVLSRFVRNASARGVYDQPALADRHDLMFDVDLFFGDSVYLFADATRDIEAQVQGLLVRVATLVGLGLWNSPRFLVRGAIAIGDLRKRIVRSEGASHEIRIGTSMTAAHRLQEAQDWIGAAVDGGTPLNAESAKWTAGTEVPLKPSCGFDEMPVAVNWVWSNGTLEKTEEDVVAAVRETGSTSAAANKLPNTLRFVRTVYKRGQFAPFERPAS